MEYLSTKFMETMYDNMWSYMNGDMIKSLTGENITTLKNAGSFKFSEKHKDTICFKGAIDSGHYVYVEDDGQRLQGYGTYECDLISGGDDGICHGAALAYFFNNRSLVPEYSLIIKPKTDAQFKKNYKNILQVYIDIISDGRWDDALYKFFYNDVDWVTVKINGVNKKTTKQTLIALKTLNAYIKKFI